MALQRVISGGQTGVDRGALESARQVGLAIGGWCPRGRRAEDGVVPAHFPLRETPSRNYAQRTAWNVAAGDATLILHGGVLGRGTALTRREARRAGRPCLLVALPAASGDWPAAVAEIVVWLLARQVAVLNVAGPRESQAPGIQMRTQGLLTGVWGVLRVLPGSLLPLAESQWPRAGRCSPFSTV